MITEGSVFSSNSIHKKPFKIFFCLLALHKLLRRDTERRCQGTNGGNVITMAIDSAPS